MDPISHDFERSGAIRIKRDSLKHCWAMAIGSHWVPLPWVETADAVSVVLWVKERTDGTAPISVEL
jgi:hypothetical protein